MPLGEAGGARRRGASGGAGGGPGDPDSSDSDAEDRGPTLSPEFVKLDRPSRFSGKHSDLENFLFAMNSYIASSGLRGQAATRFLVSYLTGDALTWWRQYV